MLRGRFVGIAWLIAAPLAAQTPDPFAGKVQNLAHPRYAEREKAARELEAAGEPALPALRAVAGSNDEELRARAAVIAERIDRTARSQRLLVAPRLALKFDKTPLDKAVAEFAAKAQIRLVLDKSKIPNPDRTVTLDTGEVPYWEAVDAFYKAARVSEDDNPVQVKRTESAESVQRLAIQRSIGSRAAVPMLMTRLADGPPSAPAANHLAIRVRAMPATYAQNKYDDLKGEVTFHLDVDPAPGFPIREIIGIDIKKATADGDRSLAPAYPVPTYAGGFGWEEQILLKQLVLANGDMMMESGSGTGQFHAVTLKTHGLRPRKLDELRGVVVARVITPPEPIVTLRQVFKEAGREATADGMTVQVKNLKRTADGRAVIQLRQVTRMDQTEDVLNVPIQLKGQVRQFIRINRGGMRADAGKLPDFKVVDAAGEPLKGLSAQVTGMTFDGTTMIQEVDLTFQKPSTGADDLSLVLMGRRSAVVEMPFVLKNVPMP